MNNQMARSLFMDYLYEELSDEKKEKLENYLNEHPELRTELDTLRQTRSLLQNMPDVAPTRKLLMVEPRSRPFVQWLREATSLLPRTSAGKAVFAAAAGFILLLLAGSAAQLHIDASGDGVKVSLGYNPPPSVSQGITGEQAEALAHTIRQENAAMLADYTADLSRQNREQLREVVEYFQQQRINDLQLIDVTLNELQQHTDDRLRLTNRYLGEVLQTVHLQDQN